MIKMELIFSDLTVFLTSCYMARQILVRRQEHRREQRRRIDLELELEEIISGRMQYVRQDLNNDGPDQQ